MMSKKDLSICDCFNSSFIYEFSHKELYFSFKFKIHLQLRIELYCFLTCCCTRFKISCIMFAEKNSLAINILNYRKRRILLLLASSHFSGSRNHSSIFWLNARVKVFGTQAMHLSHCY